MSGITLYAGDLLKNLSVHEVITLKALMAKDKTMFSALYSIWDMDVILTSLQTNSFIKIVNNDGDVVNIDDIVVRSATEEMFKEELSAAIEILEYLNTKIVGDSKSKKGFSTKSSANKKFINARLAEGYTVEDLKTVIDSKVREWSGTQFDMYLRPETLFNPTKFAGYLVKANRNGDKSKEDWNVQTT
jgi:uncharacterized phage protein (TIGR02220 family)